MSAGVAALGLPSFPRSYIALCRAVIKAGSLGLIFFNSSSTSSNLPDSMAVNHRSSSLDVALSRFLRFLFVVFDDAVCLDVELLDLLDVDAVLRSSAIIKSPVESSSWICILGLFCFGFLDFFGGVEDISESPYNSVM